MGGVIIGEFCLRRFFGMCHAPLFVKSSKFEYVAQANQDGYRFGHHYHFNSYGQRSDEPHYNKKKVLVLVILFYSVELCWIKIA